jgi:NAD(P)-dependent dehydrogenase (short-subunit alcohol dehydrogenase family)
MNWRRSRRPWLRHGEGRGRHRRPPNAAIAKSVATLDKTSGRGWTDMIDVNLGGVWKIVKAVVPQLLAGGCGGCESLLPAEVIHPGANRSVVESRSPALNHSG